ncbi:polyprenyl diphosphate synthase, partial [Clostridium sp.]
MLDIFKTNKNKINKEEIVLDKENIPKHIAIIMDGNGRWAKQRKLPRTMGHKAGVETIRRVIKESHILGIKYLTLYAFSTENWKRPDDEVSSLMKLLVEYLRSELAELNRNGVVIKVLGDINKLPIDAQKEVNEAINITKDNKGIVLNIAFNYGGRDEIIRAV